VLKKVMQTECMHFNTYFSCTVYPAKVGNKMHALSSCFISAACFSAFYFSILVAIQVLIVIIIRKILEIPEINCFLHAAKNIHQHSLL